MVTPVDALAFTPDARYLMAASAARRHAVRVFDVRRRVALGSFPRTQRAGGAATLRPVGALAVAPTNDTLVLGGVRGAPLVFALGYK